MSEHIISEATQSSRLVKALISVSQDITDAIIQKARQTNTPVIIQDEQGNIVRLDPDKLV